ncbi:MAG: precorrin-2 C(20)-methyltransferase [Hyphomicrobiales bacterium]|nr:precorrin-2 C(20)-methyltransferase [Hyphomicrobiales bacterium]
MTGGTLYGIGVGPGDPQLITLKALGLLQQAPVIAYPAPEHGESLTRRIVAPHLDARGDAFEEIALRMPIEIARFPAQEAYDQAEALLGKRLREGKDVVVLCEGDPFLYGSFMYLFARMVREFRVEVVAGVSSINACAAALGKPLCARDDRVSVLPAGLPEARLLESLHTSETCVLIKVGRHLGKLREMLRGAGLVENASYVEYATMNKQRVLPLGKFEGDAAPYFSMILVHRDGDARGLWEKKA